MRTRKETNRDRKDNYDGMEEVAPDRKAFERFKRPAYQVGRLIQEQGRQMGEKYDMEGGNASGQNSPS